MSLLSLLLLCLLQVGQTPGGGHPILVPGPGFSGATPQPPPIGGGPGANAKVIAHWDAVPHQKIEGHFALGVVAFHMNQIARVEFSLMGGPWAPVSVPAINPRTGVSEYWAIVREQSLSFGEFEVRAVAYPHTGVPRVLESIFFYADPADASPQVVRWVSTTGSDGSGDGTAGNPFRTIAKAALSIQDARGGDADTGTIYLAQGAYAYDPAPWPYDITTTSSWLTIRPAPGLTKADVSLTSSESPGLDTRLVRLTDLTVRTLLFAADSVGQKIWYDDCLLQGNGPETVIHSVGWWYGFSKSYLTECDVEDNNYGPRHATLLRDVHCRRLGDDAFTSPKLILNCTVDNLDQGSQGSWHPDVVVWNNYSIDENFILYGLKVTNAKAQGLYCGHGIQEGRSDNIAIVNVTMDVDGTANWLSQWEVPSDHVLIWHSNLANHAFGWRTPQSTLTNISVAGSVFEQMIIIPIPVGFSPGGDSVDPAWFAHNHFVDPGLAPGVDATIGSPGFVDPAADDYHLLPNSPLRNRLAPLVKVDQSNIIRSNPTNIGEFN